MYAYALCLIVKRSVDEINQLITNTTSIYSECKPFVFDS